MLAVFSHPVLLHSAWSWQGKRRVKNLQSLMCRLRDCHSYYVCKMRLSEDFVFTILLSEHCAYNLNVLMFVCTVKLSEHCVSMFCLSEHFVCPYFFLGKL